MDDNIVYVTAQSEPLPQYVAASRLQLVDSAVNLWRSVQVWCTVWGMPRLYLRPPSKSPLHI